MPRTERIHRHPQFKRCINEIAGFERARAYCGHDFGHLLDTARIAYILDLEESGALPREWIYAAALLHDIGRGEEYKQNGTHDEAGVAIAATILADCGFTAAETDIITHAVRGHREKSDERVSCAGVAAEGDNAEKARLLGDYIRRADKLARQCYECAAADTCYWPDGKKNFEIII